MFGEKHARSKVQYGIRWYLGTLMIPEMWVNSWKLIILIKVGPEVISHDSIFWYSTYSCCCSKFSDETRTISLHLISGILINLRIHWHFRSHVINLFKFLEIFLDWCLVNFNSFHYICNTFTSFVMGYDCSLFSSHDPISNVVFFCLKEKYSLCFYNDG